MQVQIDRTSQVDYHSAQLLTLGDGVEYAAYWWADPSHRNTDDADVVIAYHDKLTDAVADVQRRLKVDGGYGIVYGYPYQVCGNSREYDHVPDQGFVFFVAQGA